METQKEEKAVFVMGAILLLIFLCLWIYQSKVEADTYNRFTGRDVTLWEAMWTNLRVDCN